MTRLVLFFSFFFFFSCSHQVQEKKTLPILGERDIEYKSVHGKEVADTIYHVVPEFKFLNQDSVWVLSYDLKDKIWIVNFFFTRCPSICPPMIENMKYLSQKVNPFSDDVLFLSFSINPRGDTPKVLQQYIKNRQINDKFWYFLTGVEEEKVHNMAKEYFNGAERNENIPGGFGHTEYFALIDTERHVRGIYRGTERSEMEKLYEDLKLLLKEEGDKSSE